MATKNAKKKKIKVYISKLHGLIIRSKWVLNVNTIEPESVTFEAILLWIFKLMDAYGCKPSNPDIV